MLLQKLKMPVDERALDAHRLADLVVGDPHAAPAMGTARRQQGRLVGPELSPARSYGRERQ